jgi:hypothetical protein
MPLPKNVTMQKHDNFTKWKAEYDAKNGVGSGSKNSYAMSFEWLVETSQTVSCFLNASKPSFALPWSEPL